MSNGWYDPIILGKSLIEYSYSNSYRQIINATARDEYNLGFERYCVPQLEVCRTSTGNSSCAGQLVCLDNYSGKILYQLAADADFDVYDIRLPAPSPEDSAAASTHEKYLWNPAVMAAIGARINYTYCSTVVAADFSAAGDCKYYPPPPPRYT